MAIVSIKANTPAQLSGFMFPSPSVVVGQTDEPRGFPSFF